MNLLEFSNKFMNQSRLIFWSITSALAGFLFGFDTVVISGAEKQIQDLWSLSGSMHGLALSAALVNFFILARFIGGLGVGASTIAAPLFISEIAPAKDRGKLAGMFQFNIVFGVLIAFLSNYLIRLALKLPESPRWLITNGGRRSEGAEVFKKINPEMSDDEIEALVVDVEKSASATETDSSSKSSRSGFWSKRLSKPIQLFNFHFHRFMAD